VGSTVSVLENIMVGGSFHFGTQDTYIHYDTSSTELRIVAGGHKSVSLSSDGGTLHGTWSSESIISASDRRLKRQIEPLAGHLSSQLLRDRAARGDEEAAPGLGRALRGSSTLLRPSAEGHGQAESKQDGADRRAHAAGSAHADSARSAREGTIDWVLRELRPVSFSFKGKDPEAKFSRYGFVAQEIERIFPSMVRSRPQRSEKYVVYQDMISVLTLAAQVQQERISSHDRRANSRRERLNAQAGKLRKLHRTVMTLSERISKWERAAPFATKAH